MPWDYGNLLGHNTHSGPPLLRSRSGGGGLALQAFGLLHLSPGALPPSTLRPLKRGQSNLNNTAINQAKNTHHWHSTSAVSHALQRGLTPEHRARFARHRRQARGTRCSFVWCSFDGPAALFWSRARCSGVRSLLGVLGEDSPLDMRRIPMHSVLVV